ncbi:UDP-N-acetylmuramate dehydrogenase [Clostridium sp. AM58-1XD]|uniref:UDP-N-acetylmuramate dehydrogenase n=1 Tax=Clostridium sp. AM58-1XD TaxID=2292307 RepID=UPI000E513F5B|nr:UDP-N-acetylmuramate dehydrogenase [Clostridium sp. AM58-1XD]RGZ01922.1 UDP-N-acetylmuramate dehydrogenase [Clostridium sp. AM58-1XD]
MEIFLEKLCTAVGKEAVKTDEPMSKHTTFRVGGPADFFVSPKDEEGLVSAVSLCRSSGMPFYILGNGSNLLVSEDGYRGVMIETEKALNYVKERDGLIEAGAGILLSALAREALRMSLTGLESASGIPGTLGGAVVMNAGAYGFEMKDVLVSARVLSRDGEIKELPAEELDLGYRHSVIMDEGYIVLSACIRLHKGEHGAILDRMEELAAQRRKKQPLEYPSAGSTFKRPEGYFAGKLIQDSGLRGFQVGGAQVSEKHCGFVINRGQATADDVMELCRQVQKRVYEQFGVKMEMEVRRLGEFPDTEQEEVYQGGQ